jgi:hypothetical protein
MKKHIQKKKNQLRHIPRWRHSAPYRKDAIYYENYCCEQCYWHWGWAFESRHAYKTDCRESNYLGLLKKYWKSSVVDYEYALSDND